ncbi:hypothetical protein [Nonomuraea sp. 10N515B]|uniref:hypothetical protein n=1 Tax=Nonomuraea sp. 10N515B TaxID=3457422 RepID=UPI003FCCFA3A
MADRDILDQIDDVIHWDGYSEDAMVWTAEPPKHHEHLVNSPAYEQVVTALQPLVIDPERAQQAFARLGEQMQAFAEAFRPVAEQLARSFAAVTKAFNEIVSTPAMRELAQEQRRARSAMKSEYARRRRRRARRG